MAASHSDATVTDYSLVKQQSSINTEMTAASKMKSSLTRSTFRSPVRLSKSKITFMVTVVTLKVLRRHLSRTLTVGSISSPLWML